MVVGVQGNRIAPKAERSASSAGCRAARTRSRGWSARIRAVRVVRSESVVDADAVDAPVPHFGVDATRVERALEHAYAAMDVGREGAAPSCGRPALCLW